MTYPAQWYAPVPSTYASDQLGVFPELAQSLKGKARQSA